MNAIVITGVSTGIGKSALESCVGAGYHVFGSVRKESDAETLLKDFPNNFTPLIFDVRDTDAIQKAVKQVEDTLGKDGKLLALVNNSGIALGGPALYLDADVFRKQFEVNLFGVVSVTNAFSKLLGAYHGSKHQGKIINISSVSGKRAFPFVAPYTASKHALEGYSDALRMELMLYGVDVILVEPGPIKTAIWDKTPDPEDNPFVGTDYESSLRRFYNQIIDKIKNALPSEVIGDAIKMIIEKKRPKPRYVYTRNKFLDFSILGLLPTRFVDKIIAKALKLIK